LGRRDRWRQRLFGGRLRVQRASSSQRKTNYIGSHLVPSF
jgi:hypothetical protein